MTMLKWEKREYGTMSLDRVQNAHPDNRTSNKERKKERETKRKKLMKEGSVSAHNTAFFLRK